MQIGIIGAGIAGLVAAAAMQRDGHEVRVFERRADSEAVGAGLSLFANAFGALEAMGLRGVVEPLTSPVIGEFKAGQRRPSGAWMVVMPPAAIASLRAVHRSDLHRALVTDLAPGTLVLGREASVHPHGEAVITVDGAEQAFDLVVAADGIRSRSRARLGLDSGLRYAGYSAWRGVTEGTVDLGGEAGETWGRGRRFGVVPLPDGRVYWFATDNLPEGTVFGDEREAALERFAGWHAPIRQLIEATPRGAVLRHDIHDLAKPLSSFVKDKTVLMGDAAHAMTPDLGQGAGQGIEDAAALTLLLREVGTNSSLKDALLRYDRQRRARSQSVAQRSRAMGQVAQLGHPAAVLLRDLALQATPNTVIARGAQNVQAWSPPH